MPQPNVRTEEQPVICRAIKPINLAMMVGIVGTVVLTTAIPVISSSYSEQSVFRNGAIAQDLASPPEVRMTVTGQLEDSSPTLEGDSSPYNTYTFEGKAGEQIAILLSSQAFDAYVIVLGVDGQKIAEDDNSGGGSDALVVVTLSVDGIYTVLSNAVDREARGPYQLQWRAATTADEALVQVGKLAQESNQLMDQGRYAEAVPLAERVLELRRRALGETHPNVATSLNNLAYLYDAQGLYSEAEPLYKQALKILRDMWGNTHPNVATSLNNLAEIYRSQGRYNEAESLYKQALELRKRLLGEAHPDVATTLNNLALLYKAQGRYDEAEPIYKQALNLLRAEFGERHVLVSTILNNQALLYQEQGRYSEAEESFTKVLDIDCFLLPEGHPDIATGLNNLASLYTVQRRYSEAEPLFKQALMIRRARLGNQHLSVANDLNNLALLYKKQRRYNEAESLYNEALAIRRARLGNQHPDIAISLNNLASLYKEQKRYKEAEPFFREALAIRRTILGEKHPLVADDLNNLATFYWAQNQLQPALSWQQQGISIQESVLNRNLLGGSEVNKRDYLAAFHGTTDAALTLNLQYLPQDSTAIQLALKTLLQRKGRLLDLFTNSLQTLRNQPNPDSQALLDRLKQVNTQLSNLYHNRPETRLQSQYQQQIKHLDEQSQQLEDQLSRSSSTIRDNNAPVDLLTLQTLLPADGVLVEFSRYRVFDPKAAGDEQFGEYHYAAYLLQADGKTTGIDLGASATIDPLVADFNAAMRNPSVRVDRVKEAARALDVVLMAPIRSRLGNQKHLLISPDGPLNLIPFEALVDENNQYLVENHTLTYLTSGRDLLRLQAQSQAQQPPLLVANPLFGERSNRVNNAVSSNDLRQSVLEPLDGTSAEAEAIASQLPQAQLWQRSQATETIIKQANRPRILHIATHGFFSSTASQEDVPTENPLLGSGLFLADFRNTPREGADDGILTALEVSNLNLLGTQMVVLSACDTGQGDLSTGEGVYGLRRALVLAGSESQVISLWRVQDNSTKDLMVSYYKQLLQGKGRSEALREVQLAMIKDEQTSHPYYWAPFIQSGDWSPMSFSKSP